jgi:hypothetical protein
MASLERIRNYFTELRQMSKANLMIPVIVAILGGMIILRNKVKGY